jgi:hypothetical protein
MSPSTRALFSRDNNDFPRCAISSKRYLSELIWFDKAYNCVVIFKLNELTGQYARVPRLKQVGFWEDNPDIVMSHILEKIGCGSVTSEVYTRYPRLVGYEQPVGMEEVDFKIEIEQRTENIYATIPPWGIFTNPVRQIIFMDPPCDTRSEQQLVRARRNYTTNDYSF